MMKISDAFGSLDAYSLRARVYPGLLTVLPVACLSVVLVQSAPVFAVGPLLLSTGALFLLANIARTYGKRLEPKLVAEWGGLPTTKLLRHRQQQSRMLLERRRRAVEAVFGTTLPTKRQESADPDAADEVYAAATRCVITHLRTRSAELPLLHHENVSYGYARNMLGLKPLALAILAVTLSIDLVVYLRNDLSAALVGVAVIHMLLAVLWFCFVRPKWVREAADTYAQRLFEALEQPASTTAAPSQVGPET